MTTIRPRPPNWVPITAASLPPELVVHILQFAAWSCPSTAQSVCVLSRDIYAATHMVLYRIVRLRSRDQLLAYADSLRRYPKRATALRDLYLSNRDERRSYHTSDTTLLNDVDELPTPPDSSRSVSSDRALRYIFEHCYLLEHFHVWEPFSIGYPSEMSDLNLTCPWPIDQLRRARQAQETYASACSVPARLTSLTSLTISSLAVRIPDLDKDGPLSSLTHLHLQWPTLTPELQTQLLNLPHLRHLRLTRPSPALLLETARKLCAPRSNLRLLTVELGMYVEPRTAAGIRTIRHDLYAKMRQFNTDQNLAKDRRVLTEADRPTQLLILVDSTQMEALEFRAESKLDIVTDGMEPSALLQFRQGVRRHGCKCFGCTEKRKVTGYLHQYEAE